MNAMLTIPSQSPLEAQPPSETRIAAGRAEKKFDSHLGTALGPSCRLTWFGVLWAKRKNIMRGMVCGAAVTTIVAIWMPDRFESNVRIMVPNDPEIAPTADLATGNPASLVVRILRSRRIQDQLIDQFDLKKAYGVYLMEDARLNLAKNTAIKTENKSSFIDIEVTDHNAQRAKAISTAYVEELNRGLTELDTSLAHRERMFLEQMILASRISLDSATKEFSEFSAKNDIVDFEMQRDATIKSDSLLNAKWIAAKAELESLKEIYTSANPRVQETAGHVLGLRPNLKSNLGTSDGLVSSGSFHSSIGQLSMQQPAYADLLRRKDTEESRYEELTMAVERAKFYEARNTPRIQVLDEASSPEKHSFSPRYLIIPFGILLSGLVGSCWRECSGGEQATSYR